MEQPKKILVVEDDMMNSRLLTTILTRLGYAVDTAFDGVSGLEKVECSPPDLILLDLDLPRMDGYEVARRLILCRGGKPDQGPGCGRRRFFIKTG
jgi:CheY-like chemotaxis protein